MYTCIQVEINKIVTQDIKERDFDKSRNFIDKKISLG